MLEVHKDNFDVEVLEFSGTVLVDFWGDKCEPCKALLPHMKELADRYGHSIKFCKLNTSENRRLAIGQKVLGLPTVIVYKNGQKARELSGAENCNPEKIEELIRESLY